MMHEILRRYSLNHLSYPFSLTNEILYTHGFLQFMIVLHSSCWGLVSAEDRYKEGQMLFPTTTIGSEAGGSYIYSTAASHGSSTTDEIQLPWGSVQQQHKALQQKGPSSPRRSSSITPTTSLGSNMLEFSNNRSSSPREVGMQSYLLIYFMIFL
jgi:hypothetical protein